MCLPAWGDKPYNRALVDKPFEREAQIQEVLLCLLMIFGTTTLTATGR